MARTGYSEEIKAQVLAALMLGQGVSEIAKTYPQIKAATIRSWKSRIKNGVGLPDVITLATNSNVATQEKRVQVADLLLVYLEEGIKAMIAQAKLFQDMEWLKKQDASSLAMLHGVTSDKTGRFLESFSSNAQDTPTED